MRAIWHNIRALSGSWSNVKITGSNVDVCGVGLGIQSGGDSSYLRPYRPALIVDGDHAMIHRNLFNKHIVVDIHGSGSRIGDAVYGSGDGNQGLCSPRGLCAAAIITGSSGAAQRVTIRDAFPRGLAGLPGSGVSGGDDDPKHANNWAQTPTILSAETFHNFATVHVFGTANPFSLVDIYFADNTAYTRRAAVTTTAAGTCEFWGDLRGPLVPVQVVAASTLNDPAHPNRVGSSSEFSGRIQVTQGVGTTVLQLISATLTKRATSINHRCFSPTPKPLSMSR